MRNTRPIFSVWLLVHMKINTKTDQLVYMYKTIQINLLFSTFAFQQSNCFVSNDLTLDLSVMFNRRL